jgi:hypothetical protein
MKVPNLFANISKLKTLLFSCYYHSGLCLWPRFEKDNGVPNLQSWVCNHLERTLKFAIVVRGIAISLVVV